MISRLLQYSDAALVEPHLNLQQVRINATPVNQLVVRARFRNPSLREDQNSVSLSRTSQ
jgi:hypothetical protein